jgi:hypothetical protein
MGITGHDPGDAYWGDLRCLSPFWVTAPEGYSMSKGPSGFHHPGLAAKHPAERFDTYSSPSSHRLMLAEV